MARLDSFLRVVAEQDASDLHLHSGSVPVIRHDGDLMDLPFRVLSETETRRLLFEILDDGQKETLERERQLDFIYSIPRGGRFRASFFVQRNGLGAVFRIIPNRRPTIEELMLPPAVKRLIQLKNGLVLVTGPTGSGKTTTLAAIVQEINRTQARHIITIEDPTEFVHEPLQSVVTQREVGRHTVSFASALRSALRESPDVLIIGELRDQETVQLALSAAETGTLVFGTLHTNSAAKAVDRILDIVPEGARDQARSVLAVLLRAVIAQHLVKRAGGEGRIAAREILLQNYAVSAMIREKKIHQIEAYLHSASLDGSGAQSLDNCLLGYVQEGLVTLEDALAVADYPEQLARLVKDDAEDA
jgi:twitching motility protein PilT